MKEIRLLSICNTEDAINLYRLMIDEYKNTDIRLQKVSTDEKALRNLLQFSFDIENCLFFLLYINNEAVGFIDSSRVITEQTNSWYIKAVYLLENFRIFKNFEILINRTEKEIHQKNVKSIISTAIPFDDRTNAFWESLDYIIDDKKRTKLL